MMDCAFCINPAIARCSLIFPRDLQIEAIRIKVGDVVHREEISIQVTQRSQEHHKVRLAGLAGGEYVSVTIPYYNQSVSVTRLTECGAPCCDAHLREIDDDVIRCRRHWS